MTTTTASLTLALEEHLRPDSDETGWVLAAQRGDSDAILALLGRYRPRLVRLLAGVIGEASLAEDLAQEAFILAFQSLSQLRDPMAFYPWVRRLATRHALRKTRGRNVEPKGLADVTATSEGPARQVETRMAVHSALSRLSQEHRLVLVLREMEQLDYDEIAETLGVPVGTVRSRLFKARERFRQVWLELEGAL